MVVSVISLEMRQPVRSLAQLDKKTLMLFLQLDQLELPAYNLLQ